MELFFYGRKSNRFKIAQWLRADWQQLLRPISSFHCLPYAILSWTCNKRLARMGDVTPVWDPLCICSSAVFRHDLDSLKCFRDLLVRFSSSAPENRREAPQEPVQQSLMSAVIRVTLTMARCSHPWSLRSLFFLLIWICVLLWLDCVVGVIKDEDGPCEFHTEKHVFTKNRNCIKNIKKSKLRNLSKPGSCSGVCVGGVYLSWKGEPDKPQSEMLPSGKYL